VRILSRNPFGTGAQLANSSLKDERRRAPVVDLVPWPSDYRVRFKLRLLKRLNDGWAWSRGYASEPNFAFGSDVSGEKTRLMPPFAAAKGLEIC
jgi:hypothetical protein